MIKINGTIIIEPQQFPDGTLLLKFDKEQFDPRSTISYEWKESSELYDCLKVYTCLLLQGFAQFMRESFGLHR